MIIPAEPAEPAEPAAPLSNDGVMAGRGGQRSRPDRGLRALAVVMFVAGLALAAGTPVLVSWNHGKAERLRVTGVPVDATVTGWSAKQRSDAVADYINLTYTYHGVRYSAQTRCAASGGCLERPGPAMRIWDDPQDPGEFVTEDGNTDDANVVTGNLLLPAGALTLAGGIGDWAAAALRTRRPFRATRA